MLRSLPFLNSLSFCEPALSRWELLCLLWALDTSSERVRTQSCLTLCDPMDYIAHQTPWSTGFSRQEYWSGLPFPPPGDLPDPGNEPASPALQAGSLPPSHQGKRTVAEGVGFKERPMSWQGLPCWPEADHSLSERVISRRACPCGILSATQQLRVPALSSTAWVQTLGRPLTSCVMLRDLLTPSMFLHPYPQFVV